MRDCFAVTCTDSFLLSVFAFLCVCPLVCVCGCVCLNLHKEARGYPQVLSFRCPAWNSLCGLGSLSTEPLVSTRLCVPSTGLGAWGLPALSCCMGSGNELSAPSCFSSAQLEPGLLHFLLRLLSHSSDLCPRLLPAGVPAVEELHLF